MKNFVKHNMGDFVNFGLLLLIFLYPKPKALEDEKDDYKRTTTTNEIVVTEDKQVIKPTVNLFPTDTMYKYNSKFSTIIK